MPFMLNIMTAAREVSIILNFVIANGVAVCARVRGCVCACVCVDLTSSAAGGR